MDDPNRQIGRTTRMLEVAAKAKKEGRRILIVVARQNAISYCLRLEDLGLERRDFTTPRATKSGQMRGHKRNDIFVDHYVGADPTVRLDYFWQELALLHWRTDD